MAEIFGLDFGTTNSLAVFVANGRANSLTNQGDDLAHPSVVWYNGAETVVGRAAKQHMAHTGTGVIGDVIRSPKGFLGKNDLIHIGGVARNPTDVVADILRFLRKDALDRQLGQLQFDRCVLTIPVTMNGRARNDLRQAALKAGIHVHQFVHEPLAALYGYLRAKLDFERHIADLQNKLVLVFDWGGGTLDLTLCKFIGKTVIQVLNKGDDRVGGDHFDDRLMRFVKDKHVQKYGLTVWPGQIPGAEAKLLWNCETAKIALSTRMSHTILVPYFLRADGPERDLEIVVNRGDLESLTGDLVNTGLANIDELLEKAGVPESAIALCLATGGMIKMPSIQDRLIEKFGLARVPTDVQGDRIIAEGAAWIAHDGLRLKLAKPLELLHADDTYVSLVHEGTVLPLESNILPYSYGMYCVDPRDGFAKLQFSRPKWPGRQGPSDPREPYTTLTLSVDRTADPMLERLEVNLTIDHDLIVRASASSSLSGDHKSAEIHDLEFGLYFGSQQKPESGTNQTVSEQEGPSQRSLGRGNISFAPQPGGALRLRSNVSCSDDAWDLVPGEIVERYKPGYLDVRNNPPAFQVKESLYYNPCAGCGRYINEINMSGCDECGIRPMGTS